MSNLTSTCQSDPQRWMALFSVIVATLTVVIDGAMIGLIAPNIAKDLGANSAEIGLISSLSMLMLGAFILGGGTLGDNFGRKRFLSFGLIGVSFSSVMAFLAPDEGILMVARGLSGIMAALVNPMGLAIIMVTFDNEERPKALGLYTAALGIAGGLGTIVIAFLNQQFGWRATFGLEIFLSLSGFLLVARFVQESKSNDPKPVNWIGILLTAAGLFGIVYGINQASQQGFGSSAVLVPVGLGIILMVVLVLYSRRSKNPAFQVSLFQNQIYSVGMLLILLMSFSAMGAFFQLSTYLQTLQQVSPIQASLTLLPYTIALFIFAILAGGLVGKIPDWLLITGGLGFMTVGLMAMGLLLSPSAGFWIFLLPLILLGGGQGIANVPRLSAVLATAPPELAGAVSATNNASMQLGNSLGIAVMGALFQGFTKKTYTDDLTTMGFGTADITKSVEVLRAWLKSNSGDVASQFGVTAQQLDGIISNFQNAYTTGVTQVLWIGALLVIIGAYLAWSTFREKSCKVKYAQRSSS